MTFRPGDIRGLACPLFLLTAAAALFSGLGAAPAGALPTQLHTVIAFEAALLPGVPPEVRSYLGNPDDCLPHLRRTVCEGAYDEDADIDPRMESDRNRGWFGVFTSGTHFWDPDGGPSGGRLDQVGYIPVNLDRENAYQRALGLYRDALARYPGDPHAAYYLLGRAVHLLTDMATPAHTHLDPHVSDEDSTGDDSFEEFLAEAYTSRGNLAGRTSFEDAFVPSGLAPQDPAGMPTEGFDTEHPLFRLFLSMARHSQRFDSDDADGASDGGARRGRSIAFTGGMPEGAFALSGQRQATLPDGAVGLSPGRGKLVIAGPVLDTLLSADPAFTHIRFRLADGFEDHALTEFRRSDISDDRTAPVAAALMPAAVGHAAALFRLFWEETHPSLAGSPPLVSLSRARRELRVVRPSPVTLLVDIEPEGWRDAEVEAYLWADAPGPEGPVQLYYDGRWQPFPAFPAMKPLAAPFRLSAVSGLEWTLLEETSGLPNLHFTVTLCLDTALDGTFTPEQSACGALLVVVTSEMKGNEIRRLGD